ncbi:MAG: hypothetical protein JWP85_2410 [Rhodoglobus sp.]|nr:hypothetical protein [Rhodoglobus sp.]
MNNATWANQFVLASRERELGRSAELLAAVRAGELVPVSRGVYRHSRAVSLDPQRRGDDEYLARIRAAQLRASQPLVIAGMSAAAVWELPVVGAWPTRVAVSAAPEPGGRSNAHLARSYVGFPPPTEERDGLRVTTLPRTVVDIGRTESMARAVAVTDAALRGQKPSRGRAARRGITKFSVERELNRLAAAPGVAKARGILSFADGKSGSAGESCSRVGMWRLGLPAPRLQETFTDERGLIGIVDFWWPEYNLVGEFDGMGKYLRDEFRGGRTTADIVMEEKVREDRLRALGLGMVRWGWPVAMDLRLLEAKLRGAGLGRR